MVLERFHPAVAAWFKASFAAPTACQERAWPAIQARRHTLIAAPTGSGKTLAAFLAVIDALVRQAETNSLPEVAQVLYISPLKALSNDIQHNLKRPLQGIGEQLRAQGLGDLDIRTMVRTGDTSRAERVTMHRRPPHIVVTTPESFYILLTSHSGRETLSTIHTVIVDEIHAVAPSKRGAHLALSLERLEALTGREVVRIGLSATLCPIEELARFLVGTTRISPEGHPDCMIIDLGHVRDRDLAIEVPRSPLQAVMSNEVWEEVYDRLAELILAHRTTLVFVNTRRMAERVTRHLSERLGEQHLTAHHGSLAREHRLLAEQRLKGGTLRALVATASLELGIDIGEADLVCQLGSTRSIATFLQRIGRSGHGVGRLPKGRLFPLSRDDLIECVALIEAARCGKLDRLTIPAQPLDVLAQQIVAMVACEVWDEGELWERIRRAYPYRDLSREDFNAVVRMLAEGFSTRWGRRSAYLHRDAVNQRLRARRGARLTAITSGGAIPDTADYEVRQEPTGVFVGTLNEDFAIESLTGDIFQLGNTSWRILGIEAGVVRVEDAHGQPPNIPFWFGEAPARTVELSSAVSRVREQIEDRLLESGIEAACEWLVNEMGIIRAAAEQVVDYLAAAQAALGVIPTQKTMVLERFFDESGGMQLVVHSPFGSRLNRAWGLALRKRFCSKFNFELQAAATEDAVVLSLGQTHSFPLAEVWDYLNSATVRELLVQALLDAPMFTARWRWNATTALAIPRFRAGRKVPARLQRMYAEDLMAVVFPDQRACLENLAGKREIPDHPLVHQSIHDCLTEAMDIDSLESLLRAIKGGEKRLVARDLTAPSPLAQEILNAKPYAYLDDVPLQERRTQAVISRRWLDPETAAELGQLDPEAIERVRREAWPEPQSPEELHDALLSLGFITEEEGTSGVYRPHQAALPSQPQGWHQLFEVLVSQSRAALVDIGWGRHRLWVAAERLPQILAVYPQVSVTPCPKVPKGYALRAWSREEAIIELVRGRLEGLGAVTVADLARGFYLAEDELMMALLALQAEGSVLRGHFTAGISSLEWCERRLLARIHRYTINRLRREIEPVCGADFMRFLLHWHQLDRESPLEGPQALLAVLEQLEGFEAPAAAWESEILPARIADYQPQWLDALCFSGRFAWRRLSNDRPTGPHNLGLLRTTPVALVARKHLPFWQPQSSIVDLAELKLTTVAHRVAEYLSTYGASFFEDLVDGLGLLRTQVEAALGELVTKGLVSSDSFAGLRALLAPANRRRCRANNRHRAWATGFEEAGRWALTCDIGSLCSSAHTQDPGLQGINDPPLRRLEVLARALLRRYGVVFRRLTEREASLPSWRELIKVYHRLEARGELRGGRFVAIATGEQFALPEAVGLMREVRRKPKTGELISVSGADPLNLIGIITPGGRVPALMSNRLLYCDGLPTAIQLGREVRFLDNPEPGSEWTLKQALIRCPSASRRPGRLEQVR